LVLFHLQDQEPVADIDGVGDKAARLIPHRLLDFRTQLAFLVSADIAVLLDAGRIGIVAHEILELLALLAAIRQVLGFLLSLRGICSGRRRHQKLPQKHPFLALKLVLVAVVVLLRFVTLDLDLGCDFLANHAIGQQIVLAIVLVIFIGHSGLVPDVLLKLVGIGDAGEFRIAHVIGQRGNAIGGVGDAGRFARAIVGDGRDQIVEVGQSRQLIAAVITEAQSVVVPVHNARL